MLVERHSSSTAANSQQFSVEVLQTDATVNLVKDIQSQRVKSGIGIGK